MKIGNKEFDTAKHTYIMGILNVTPDSFSDGGKWNGYDAAMRHAEEEISEMLLKAQKFAEDIDKSNPVRRIASADLSADPDALES